MVIQIVYYSPSTCAPNLLQCTCVFALFILCSARVEFPPNLLRSTYLCVCLVHLVFSQGGVSTKSTAVHLPVCLPCSSCVQPGWSFHQICCGPPTCVFALFILCSARVEFPPNLLRSTYLCVCLVHLVFSQGGVSTKSTAVHLPVCLPCSSCVQPGWIGRRLPCAPPPQAGEPGGRTDGGRWSAGRQHPPPG